MLFNSFAFLVFFPSVTTLYFLTPQKLRWLLLLGASCFFYMWFIPKYILVLALLIVIDYSAAILINRSGARWKKICLIASVMSTCLALFIFKYFNFFSLSVVRIGAVLGWNLPLKTLAILLPIGLSFHTFQSLSYVIEVYRGKQKPERHFGIYALYVMFYPQLIAGPIERPQNLLHQFRERHAFDYQNAKNGLLLMAWGMLKKIAIADRLAPIVSGVYANPHAVTSKTSFVVATVFFAFQIYCDFSGYTDIARGAAQVMGFRLMLNFNRPYFAKSTAEFWHRWHISLSTWFRDYLYIPLGGSRRSNWRWQFNLLVTFLISGLWHGAQLTFVAWGALNGMYLIGARLKQRFLAHPMAWIPAAGLRCLQTIGTFSLICISWVFFRANRLQDAFYILRCLPAGFYLLSRQIWLSMWKLSASQLHFAYDMCPASDFIMASSAIGLLVWAEYILKDTSIVEFLSQKSPFVRWMSYSAIFWGIFLGGKFTGAPFIYFVF